MKTQLIIIQSTSFCNVNCRYCYLPNRLQTKKISLETISQIFKHFFSSPFSSEEITVVWHAGEPLVLPTSFYEEAFHLIKQWNIKGLRISHSFQTNATLITQEWCNFFKKHHVQVGVSLDGPKHIHDANRIDRAGKGTFERVMQGVALLKKNEITFSVIAVVTKNSLTSSEEIWNFFMDVHPARLGLNAEEIEGINNSSSLQTEDDIEQYKKFFKNILALETQYEYPIFVRESEFIMKYIKGSFLQIRSQTNVAGTILSFDCDGNISTFSPELLTMTHSLYKNFIFGNVFENKLEDIFSSQKFIEVNKQIQRGVRKCQQSCDYFMFCGGGFPSNKLYENGTFDSTETKACRLRIKATVDATLEHLEDLHNIEYSKTENNNTD